MSATTPTLADPGFELPALGSGVFQYQPAGSPWTFTASAGLAGNGSAVTSANPNAPQGSQVAFLQGTGYVSQNVTFPAGVFAIGFSAAQRGNNQASAQTFQVLVDGIAVGTFNNLAGTSYTPLTTTSFAVTAGSHLITFRGTDLNGGDNTALVDQVAITVSDFQTPAVGSGFQYNPAGASWSFSGTAGLAGNGSAFTANNPGAPGGTQVAFLQSMGSMSQNIVFAPGTYDLSFSAAQRGNYQASTQTFQVLVDGTVVGTFNTLTGTSYTALTTSSFTVTAGSHTIVFQGTNLNGGDNTVLVDQLAIDPLPTSLADSGFETPALTNGAYKYDPSGSPWTFNAAGVAANGSAFTRDNPNAPQGNQVAFIQVGGTMSYDVSFSAAQRGNYQTNSQTFQVLVDGAVVGTFDNVTGTNYTALTTAAFTVSPGASHQITFQGTDLHGGDNTVLIDQVSVNPLPIGVSDPGFVIPNIGAFSYHYDPPASPWTFTGSAGVTGEASLFTAHNAYPPFSQAPPWDIQVAFLQSVSSISQVVTFPPGTYTIGFVASQRGNLQASLQTFEVLIDGTVIGTFNNVPATPAGQVAYIPQVTPSFTVTAGSHTVTFQGTDIYGGDNTIFLDDIAINPVAVGPNDPGFEMPAVGYGLAQTNPAGAAWAFSGNGGVSANNSPITSGNPIAPAGRQVAFLQGTGSASQNVTLPFGTYQIGFSAAQRGNVPDNAQTFEVLVDGNVVGTFNTLVDISYRPLTTPSFTVNTGSHTITFQGTDLNGGNYTILLDEIALNPLPPLDGSFEIPVPSQASGAYTYDPTGSPWTFSGTAGLAANGSAFTVSNAGAPEGNQVAFIQALGSISQSFTTLPAGTYDVTFSAAQRGSSQASFQTFEVLLDGRVIGAFNDLMSTSYTPLTTSRFTVAAGLHTLLFQGTDVNGGDNTVFVDQVVINKLGA